MELLKSEYTVSMVERFDFLVTEILWKCEFKHVRDNVLLTLRARLGLHFCFSYKVWLIVKICWEVTVESGRDSIITADEMSPSLFLSSFEYI